jgi:phage terminase large subunit
MLQPSRYKGISGGRGSAKSHFFAELLIDDSLCNPGLRSVCIREHQVSLARSSKQLIEDKIKLFKLGSQFKIKNNYIETPGDGVVIFQGMKNHTNESIKSLEGFDRAWVEEAQSLSKESLKKLRPTIRKPGSELWFSWNPANEKDAVDEFFRGPSKHPDALYLHTTFRDNPFFPEVLREEMLYDRSRDPDMYAHVWLGEYEKNSELRVFKNWKEDEFDTPSDAVFYFGADWGYSVDPAVLVRCFIRGRTLFIDHEAYKIGVEIDHLPAHFDKIESQMARQWVIRADSSRPDTISYMKRHGYPKIQAAKKGPDSVKDGVIFLQGFDIVVHPRCTHVIDELTHYSYKKDKETGDPLPILEDKKNHVIDSLRYATEELYRAKKNNATWGS